MAGGKNRGLKHLNKLWKTYSVSDRAIVLLNLEMGQFENLNLESFTSSKEQISVLT
jgi:hypothetical protein